MKTVLVYVLSANIQPYRQMIRNSLDTWDADHMAGVPTAYYSGNPPHEHPAIKSYPVDEAYETMGIKDIMAYLDSLEWKWDYMARVAAACYVHKGRLLEYAQRLPAKGLMRGLVVDAHAYCGIQHPFIWGGGQFIFSRDVIEAFVANADKWRHDLMEDVAMSELARESGFELDGAGRCCSINKTDDGWNCVTYGSPIGGFDFKDFADVQKLEDQFFFRVKCDWDRNVDAQVMRLLKQHLPA